MVQEETREILESRRREIDGSNNSSADNSVDSTSHPLAFLDKMGRGRMGRGNRGRGGKGEGRPRALVIDGNTLQFVLDPALKPLFLDIARRCVSVICSRTTPIQKVIAQYHAKLLPWFAKKQIVDDLQHQVTWMWLGLSIVLV